MKVKSWQMVLIVVGLIVCAGSIAWTLTSGDAPKINRVLHYVDVETGDIYVVDVAKNNIGVPGMSPGSGKMSLVRLAKKEGGGWYVDGHDRQLLRSMKETMQIQAVDEKTGELKDPSKTPIDYVRR